VRVDVWGWRESLEGNEWLCEERGQSTCMRRAVSGVHAGPGHA
jgi:hypothetical protein